jgi:hypothetical protein
LQLFIRNVLLPLLLLLLLFLLKANTSLINTLFIGLCDKKKGEKNIFPKNDNIVTSNNEKKTIYDINLKNFLFSFRKFVIRYEIL